MTVRLVDVAQYVGVSPATVSRVLANKPHVREEIRRRVLAAVEELGYQPSRVARSLRGQQAQIIGVIISDIQNPFFTSLVRAVEDMAYTRQHAIFLCNSDEQIDKERLYIDLMRSEQVAGVVATPTHEYSKIYQHLLDAKIPLVVVDRRLPNLAVDTVVVDNVQAAFGLVSHLIEDGHYAIGGIFAESTTTTGRERHEGYKRALQAYALPYNPKWVRLGKPKTTVGYHFTQELLNLPQRPTALFTGNNLLTVGTLRAIQERGLRIPDDVALVAFDDLDWMSLLQPQLTVVAQPTYELGRIAAELLFSRIANPAGSPQEVVLQTRILIRQSCARHHLHLASKQ